MILVVQAGGGADAEGVWEGADSRLHLRPRLLTVLDVPLWYSIFFFLIAFALSIIGTFSVKTCKGAKPCRLH